MYDLSHRLASGAPAPFASPVPLARLAHRTPAHRFRLADPRLQGAVVWNEGDGPGEPEASDPLLHTVVGSARRARGRPEVWATEDERARLTSVLPTLRDEAVWMTFAATWDDAILPRHVLPFIKRKGWRSAAVVFRGALMNVVQQVPGEPAAVPSPEAAEWTMVGLIRGDTIEVHGFRDEGHRPGRTVCACLAGGPLDVSLYPLS